MDNCTDKPTRADTHSIVFVSSFSYETEGYPDPKESPLYRLREDLRALNRDESFLRSLPLIRNRQPTWVAAETGEDLRNVEDKLAVVDQLVETIRASENYVCILADRRQGTADHGTAVRVRGEETATSYFEIELYAAAMYAKRLKLFLLDGFEPGPRLRDLLEILRWAIPDWQDVRPQQAAAILSEIRALIRRQCTKPPKPEGSLRRRLATAFYRNRAGAFSPIQEEPKLLFLNGFVEDRPRPEIEHIEQLITEYRAAQNFRHKMIRLWITIRELMSASYRQKDVQANSTLREFLPYWDCVLGDWAGAASWHGWHGHLYAGTIAPLNSQLLIRAQGLPKRDDLHPEILLPPDGALASAYYGVAKILGMGFWYGKCLRRAGQHVKRAIEARSGPTDNLLAIRGSIRLRSGDSPGAISDFTEMLRIRETGGASEIKIADALMHLGQAYTLRCPLLSKGRNLLKESVRIFEKHPYEPNLARARRKLALAYKLAGKFVLASETSRQAEVDASRIGADDQVDR